VDVGQFWLDHVQKSTVRLGECTASFVSPDGLILTNHHCSAGCLDENSSAERNLFNDGFLARRRDQELRCRTQIANVLMAVEDVTAKVAAAIHGLDDKAANDARKKKLTQLEQACEEAGRGDSATGAFKCEAVDLYSGGQQFIYKYRRYDDVRLVFAPEWAVAAFGGDLDNFQFPRWDLDVSVLRAYSNGKPAETPQYLKINFNGPNPGEPVFASGHPGLTDRLLTVAQLETRRNVGLPRELLNLSELRGRYIQYSKTGTEAQRTVFNRLNRVENDLKVRRKLLDALLDDRMLDSKRRDERLLRARAAKDGGDPWADIEHAEELERGMSLPYSYLEGTDGFNSQLFRYARLLVRGAAELTKPNTERLREFSDAALPRIEQQLRAAVPVYPELEKLTLSFSLERMRGWLGPDDTVVRQLLSHDSPDMLAARLVEGSKLADPAVRIQLWQGGAAAIAASADPMILLARNVDAAARAVRKDYEDKVEAPERAAAEEIAQLRFAALGTSVAPDANFTLRLSFGSVQGWEENGSAVPPFTQLSRLFERATGNSPFAIPQSWVKAKDRLDLNTKFNLVTNNDVVGGNSGSPLIDAHGDIVGLLFDGNIHSIANRYWFDAKQNRAVAVHPAIVREALTNVYGAHELAAELGIK
jgi:hypothetical protein